MSLKWCIYDHHIALESESEIMHPSANEVYSLVFGYDHDAGIPNPSEQLPDFHFSTIGSPIKCELVSENNSIILKLYAIRKNENWPIDMIDGQIIDHGICESNWFYVNGDIDNLQKMFSNARINKCGELTIGQYIDLIKQDYFSPYKYVINNVDKNTILQLMSPVGDIPAGIKATLYNYQKTGFLWMNNMISASHGCILGDEMGLGKTLQVITVFEQLKEYKRIPELVVAPVSLLENWKRECAKFAPKLDVYIHHGSKRTGHASELAKHDVVVISYNTAISDLSMLKMIEWECVVLDEAQNIKNPYSERTKSVKAITRNSGIAVTGTPFENHITDIWSLVDFTVPGLLGSLGEFQKNVTDDVLGAEKIEPILSPIMIRRLVKDVANDLPEKVIIPQPINMSEEERSEYEEYRNEANKASNNGKTVSIALLQKLRMYCTHRYLCKDEYDFDPVTVSIKYQRFCEIVEEIAESNEKVIVFTSYKKMFDIFKRDIPARFGIELDFINGDTPVPLRQRIVDWFNEYEGSAMLVLNPRAAGTGLNITGANHVIHYNLEWNPSLEDQSSARAYRRGQDKTVFIYRLYYVNTVEQVVNERIERKREIASVAVIGTDGENEKNDIMRALELAPEIREKG